MIEYSIYRIQEQMREGSKVIVELENQIQKDQTTKQKFTDLTQKILAKDDQL